MEVQQERSCQADYSLESHQIRAAGRSTRYTRTPRTTPKRTPTNTRTECSPLRAQDGDRRGPRRSLQNLSERLSGADTIRSPRNPSREANKPPSKPVDRRERLG